MTEGFNEGKGPGFCPNTNALIGVVDHYQGRRGSAMAIEAPVGTKALILIWFYERAAV